MKDVFDIVITEDGNIEAIYQDGLAELLGAKETKVCRVSNVEWEQMPIVGSTQTHDGWTVRAVHDPRVAIRCTPYHGFVGVTADPLCLVVVFATREEALEAEVKHFWQLKEKNNG